MPELKSTYIGELMMEITGSYMLGELIGQCSGASRPPTAKSRSA